MVLYIQWRQIILCSQKICSRQKILIPYCLYYFLELHDLALNPIQKWWLPKYSWCSLKFLYDSSKPLFAPLIPMQSPPMAFYRIIKIFSWLKSNIVQKLFNKIQVSVKMIMDNQWVEKDKSIVLLPRITFGLCIAKTLIKDQVLFSTSWGKSYLIGNRVTALTCKGTALTI